MPVFDPKWHALSLGGLPHVSAEAAWDSILRHTPAIPSWPQLPKRSHREGMYAQFSERFPGINLGEHGLRVHRSIDIEHSLERFYLAYLENDLSYGAVTDDYAKGLSMLLQDKIALPDNAIALKGQITGPVSWGLSVIDDLQQPILHDRVLGDAVSKHISLKAAWQEQQLSKHHSQTILLVDEPYLASLGSTFVRLSQEQAANMLEEVFASIKGLKGIHCCGDPDWPLVLNTSADIVSFDAYDYGSRLAQHGDQVARFLARGGILAWGIVPAGAAVRTETLDSLLQRLEDGIEMLVERGVPREAIHRNGLVSPSCSLGRLRPELAERVLDLTQSVSIAMRERLGIAAAPSTDASS